MEFEVDYSLSVSGKITVEAEDFADAVAAIAVDTTVRELLDNADSTMIDVHGVSEV